MAQPLDGKHILVTGIGGLSALVGAQIIVAGGASHRH